MTMRAMNPIIEMMLPFTDAVFPNAALEKYRGYPSSCLSDDMVNTNDSNPIAPFSYIRYHMYRVRKPLVAPFENAKMSYSFSISMNHKIYYW